MIIETEVIDHLKNKTSAGAHIYAQRPAKSIPGKYVIIEKTGSSTEDMITTSTIAIQSVSDSLKGGSMLDAIQLNEEVKAAMLAIIERDSVSKCALNSDYNFTDNSTKEYRYQAVFQITHY